MNTAAKNKVHAEARSSRSSPTGTDLPSSVLAAPPRGKNAVWVTKTLGEVLLKTETVNPALKPNTSFQYIDISSVSNATFSIENAGEVLGKDAPSRARKLVRSGDVLFATVRPTLQRICIIPDEFDGEVCSTGFFVLRPAPSLNNRYLFYYLLSDSFTDRMEALQKGASYPAVNDSEVKEQSIPLPPLDEQRRIVGVLDEAFAGIAAAKATAEKNLQNARAIFDSHLDSVFSQRGLGWVEKSLADVCEITSTLVDPKKAEFQELTHVGAGNIEAKTGAFVDLKTAREEGLISGKFLFDESMVLYSKIRPYLMKVARPDFSGLCSADMYPLAPISKQISRDYLYHLLLSKTFTDYAILGSARAGMPKVNREHLFEFKVWLPGIKKQEQLAAELDVLAAETTRLAGLYQRKLDALEALKKSLLHRAFAGEL